MKEYAEWFYKSQAWKKLRREYAKSVGGLCEHCLKDGIIRPGEIVHHKVHITPQNIYDTSITLNPDNLVLVCRECHAKEHGAHIHRYKVDELGRLID